MKEKSYFVKDRELRMYNVQNVSLNIEVNPLVFPPPMKSPIIARHMRIERGENVIDIGTGSGILAILAAKLGAKVYATDNDKNSIELANKNACINEVTIDAEFGNFFGEFDFKFDVIIANLSQTILHERSKESMGELSNSVDGGASGNKQIIKLLELAKNHMHNKSRLYVNVYTISDYKNTIKKILQNYNAKLIESEEVKEFVYDNIEWYKKLNEEGIIRLFHNKSSNQWFADQLLFELTLKSHS